MGPDPIRDWLYFAAVVLLGICSYFLKRSVRALDKLQEKFHDLDKRVAVILDRDRRKRLEDYNHSSEEDLG